MGGCGSDGKEEGLCVQCMHFGSYDDEPATVELMKEYAGQKGFSIVITPEHIKNNHCNPKVAVESFITN